MHIARDVMITACMVACMGSNMAVADGKMEIEKLAGHSLVCGDDGSETHVLRTGGI